MSLRNMLGQGWLALLAGLIFLISQGLIASILHEGNASSLLFQFQFTYDAASFSELLAHISDDQLAALQAHFHYDHIHPLWYGLLIMSLTAWLLKVNQLPARWDLLIILGAVPSVMDVIENSLHEPVFMGITAASQPAIALAGACATTKWLLAALYSLFAIVLAVRATKNRPS